MEYITRVPAGAFPAGVERGALALLCHHGHIAGPGRVVDVCVGEESVVVVVEDLTDALVGARRRPPPLGSLSGRLA